MTAKIQEQLVHTPRTKYLFEKLADLQEQETSRRNKSELFREWIEADAKAKGIEYKPQETKKRANAR